MPDLKTLLDTLSMIARDEGLSTPYIVGGVPRDKVLGVAGKIDDVDLTTGDGTIHTLASTFNRRIPDSHLKVMNDGHSQVTVDNYKFDFSSNFRSPGIKQALQKAGLKNPSEMLMELLSRDFTVNTLLMTLDLKSIKDLTGRAIPDIEKKLLRTCLPPHVTFGDDKKRIIRVLYIAAKLGLTVNGDIVEWVRKNPQKIAEVKPQYLKKKLQKALDYNFDRTIGLINDMNLWDYIPITEDLLPYFTSRQL